MAPHAEVNRKMTMPVRHGLVGSPVTLMMQPGWYDPVYPGNRDRGPVWP